MKKFMFYCSFMLLLSCTNEKVETNGLKDVSERHASQLNIHQLIDALLICAKNDTTKVCYALVMPKQSLIRLSKGETYPTETSFKKSRELFVDAILSDNESINDQSEQNEDQKDWLIKNSINEPINAIWEQITEER